MKLTQTQMIVGGGVLLIAAVVWLLQKGSGQSIGEALGGAVVGAVVGTASGASNALVDAANSPVVNPLYPVGAWVGGTIYDLTHW